MVKKHAILYGGITMLNCEKISTAEICNFITECESNENVNLINLAVLQGNDVIAEFCKKPYKKDRKQLLFSMTKSFTSLAIGIAIDQGLLSLDDYVISFFHDDLPVEPHSNLMKMKVRHLLTMTSGIHNNTYSELFPQSNWIKAFLSQDFPHDPGTFYRYSTHATHMLSAIIQRVSGNSLEDFLNTYMFNPMDIYEAEWELSPEGLTAGGMGLSLYPASLIKVAAMLLNKGVYCGKRVISEEYIAHATFPQVIKQDDVNDPNQYYSGYQYGFQFHISSNSVFRADGAFGQFMILYPPQNLAIVATSQRTKTETFLSLVDKYFLRAENSNTLNASNRNFPCLSGLTFLTLNKSKSTCNILQGTYKLDRNELDIESVILAQNKLQIFYATGICDEIYYVLDKPVYGTSHFVKDLQIHLQEHCALAIQEDDSFLLKVFYIETPYVLEYKLSSNAKNIEFSFNINVSMTLKGFMVQAFRDA